MVCCGGAASEYGSQQSWAFYAPLRNGESVPAAFKPQTAIVGIGATEFSKNSGRSELRLALEAVTAALADAAIDPLEVDGLVSFSMDPSDEVAVARNLGVRDLTYFVRTPGGGGGACGTVALASLGIATGMANVVVCYRAMNERSGHRFGQPGAAAAPPQRNPPSRDIDRSWNVPFGMVTAASMTAPVARRYMHQYGATSEDFGLVSVNARNFAATNPAAWFYEKPITLDDHQNSRMIADPLRLLDCCQESDGAVALVVTSLERAKDLPQPPVAILASAQGSGPNSFTVAQPYRENLARAVDVEVIAKQLWAQSGLKPQDMDLANCYDHFTPAVLMQLEGLGFCGLGEAAGFIRDEGIGLDGRLPVNTNGGQIGEAYIHGFNGIAEVVRQLRGTAVNQVPNARHAAVISGIHAVDSGLILGRD